MSDNLSEHQHTNHQAPCGLREVQSNQGKSEGGGSKHRFSCMNGLETCVYVWWKYTTCSVIIVLKILKDWTPCTSCQKV